MHTPFFRPLLASGMVALAATSIGFGAVSASAESVGSDTTQVALDESGNARSVIPTEDGLKLNTVEGDDVSIVNNVASWYDEAGNLIASIDLSNESDEAITFVYDEAEQTIVARTADRDPMTRAACMPKWVAWAFNITWGALVCVPATAGATAIATPIEGITTEIACTAAGGAMITAVSC